MELENPDIEKERIQDVKLYSHKWLGQLFEVLLTPKGVSVHTDYQLMSNPPSSDLLLFHMEQKGWRQDQKAVLPDGIRDVKANQILIEFKYSESLNKKVMKQVSCYDHFYKQTQNLKDDAVRTFLLSSKTPRQKSLDYFGFKMTDKKGVYQGTGWELENITLLSLNDLSLDIHNAYMKCFASKKKEQEAAFALLSEKGFSSSEANVEFTLISLKYILFKKKGGIMSFDPSTIKLSDLGKKIKEDIIASLTPDDILKTMKLEDILKRMKPEDILKRMKPEDIRKGLKPEDIFKIYKPDVILKKYKPKERLEGLKPKERLEGLKPEEIESYLKELKSKQSKLVHRK